MLVNTDVNDKFTDRFKVHVKLKTNATYKYNILKVKKLPLILL